jgi:hypothetical protein
MQVILCVIQVGSCPGDSHARGPRAHRAGTTDLQISVDDAKRLAAAKKSAKLRLIDGMNHVLKHATLPAEQAGGVYQLLAPY